MSEQLNLFTGDLSKVGEVDLERPLSAATQPCCTFYDTAYKNAALEAQSNGDSQVAATYKFLSVLTNFAPTYDTPQEPYKARLTMGDKRSVIPSDLSHDDIIALQTLAPLIKDPALRARLFDLVWMMKKDHTACAEAAKQYLDAADRLNTREGWTYAENLYHRGVYLAAQLGRAKGLYTQACTRLVTAVKTAIAEKTGAAYKYLKLLLKLQCGDPKEFLQVAFQTAEDEEKAGNQYIARLYWEVGAELAKWAGDNEKERKARLSAAETYVAEAEQKGDGPSGSGIAGASLLQKGIEALRRAGADRARIEVLKEKLAVYQAASLNEMQTFSTKVDVSADIRAARKLVTGLELRDAIFKFALTHPLENPCQLKEDVEQQAAQTPFIHMIGASLLDDKGRVAAVREGLWDQDEAGREKALEDHAFNNGRFYWQLRVLGYVEPAREQIQNEHNPSMEDLTFLVLDNPVIPPGHEGIFLRGLHAGFHGDLLVASHVLVPQIENSLRYILESAGVDISNLMSDGTQPVKVLGALLSVPELEQVLGPEAVFELRGHLIEKCGYDFRNRLSHGFVTAQECYSVEAASIWWLVLRLCSVPLYNMQPSVSIRSLSRTRSSAMRTSRNARLGNSAT